MQVISDSSNMFVAVATIVAITLIAIYLRQRQKQQKQQEQQLVRRPLPPGPRPWPLLGNLLELRGNQPHVTLARLAANYGPIFGLQLGQVYAVVLADGGLIREALRLDALTGRAPLYVTHGIMGGYGEFM